MGDAAVAMADAQALRDQINQKSDVASIVSALTVNRALDQVALVADEARAAATAPVLPMAGPMLQAENPDEDEGTTLLDLIQPTTEDPREGLVGQTRLWAQTESRARHLLRLEAKRKKMEARLAGLRRKYLGKHPLMVSAERALNETAEDMEIEISLARAGIEADYLRAKSRFEQLQGMFQELSARQLAQRGNALEVQGMKEDSGRVKGLHSALLQKLLSIDVGSQFNSRTVTLLEPAIVLSNPIYPKKLRGMVIAAFMGIGVGLALAFFIEYIDDSIKLAEEVERELQLPFLGMVPAAQWDPDDLTAHRLDQLKQQGGVAEAYRVVRSAILFSFPREKLRSLLVTSAVPREGKTTTGVNMAIGFSQIEDRVLLVDGDLRRGEVHKYFSLERDQGLAEVLLGEVTPEEAVRQTEVPKLDVLTCGAYPSNPAELLLGWRLKEFLDWAYQRYNRVVFDGPPLMGIADSAILGSAVDGVMLIIWAGRTSRRYVRVAKMTAASRGAKLFGFMLNNLEPGRVGYYHYYPYYYSYYSRGYYYTHRDDEEGKGGDLKGVPAPANPEESPQQQIDDVY
ncbi:polysaccharide biosynthesis tyrosine autokinase [bacterium]|nr:polysaccharide biosynthesis tyrosine autokinase [bacterium]